MIIANDRSTHRPINCGVMGWEIARLIVQGRRKTLSEFIDIPKDVSRDRFEEYVRAHNFKECCCVDDEMRAEILDHLDEINS